MKKNSYNLELATIEQGKEIYRLMQLVYDEITDKDTFVCDDLLYVEKHIRDCGFVVIALDEQRKIVGCLIVDIPKDSPDNLGFDVGLDFGQRSRVAHMDSAVVHPIHRGNRLQSKMISYAETCLWQRWIGEKSLPFFLVSTVSPNNPASYETLESIGYCHVCTKEKYGSLQRRIYCKYMLTPEVFYVPGGSQPLSSEVFFVQGKEHLYVYDVGADEKSLQKIQRHRPDVCILSHFHKDHTTNLREAVFETLYVDKKTKEHFPEGITVEQSKHLSDGVNLEIISAVTSHSKMALLLNINQQILLVGDALYAIASFGKPTYNVQQLKELIDILEQIQAEYVVLSHDKQFVYSKEEALKDLKSIYDKRTKDSAYIFLDNSRLKR